MLSKEHRLQLLWLLSPYMIQNPQGIVNSANLVPWKSSLLPCNLEVRTLIATAIWGKHEGKLTRMYFQYREHKSLPCFAVLVPFQASSECANLVIPVKDAFTLKDGAVTMLTKRFLHVVRQLRFILHIDETSRCIAKSATYTNQSLASSQIKLLDPAKKKTRTTQLCRSYMGVS